MIVDVGDNFYWNFSPMQNCPICNSKMKNHECSSGCFKVSENNCYVIIFNEYVSTHNHTIERLNEKVRYWKENDRYLTAIMGVYL